MNDVTEPLVADKRYGGLGIDYHLVPQEASRLIDFFANDTGLGRVASFVRFYTMRQDLRTRWESYGVRRMVEGSVSQSEMTAAWEIVLRDFEGIYNLARNDDLPVILLIFPGSSRS